MSWIYSTVDKAPSPLASDVAPFGDPVGFGEAFGLAMDVQAYGGDLTNSPAYAMDLAREERRRLIEEFSGSAYDEALKPFKDTDSLDSEAAEAAAIERYAQTLAPDKRGRVLLGRDLEARSFELARAKWQEAEARLARATGMGQVGAFGGGFAGAMRDPAVLATLPFGAPAWSSAARFILTEALIGAGTEAFAQPYKQQFRAQIGRETGFGVAAREVLEGAAFGAGFAGAAKGAAFGWRQLVRQFDGHVKNPTAEQRAARNAAEKLADAEDANPFEATREGANAGAAARREAALAMARGEDLPPAPPPDVPQRGDDLAADPSSPPRMGWPEERAGPAVDLSRPAGEAIAVLPDAPHARLFDYGRAVVEGTADDAEGEALLRLFRGFIGEEPDVGVTFDNLGDVKAAASDYFRDLSEEGSKKHQKGQRFDAWDQIPDPETRVEWLRRHGGGPVPMPVSGQVYRIAASDLHADPARFQFKSGVNAEGVTEKLSGARQWDADAGGVVTAWQDASGRFWIADGHHRLALARRLMADGHAPIDLEARVYREADGHTAESVMMRAALTNIMNETGTILDAAKLFRARPEAAAAAGLDASSAFAAAARGMARLSDDAFLQAVNETIPQRLAGLVGEMLPDRPELHAAIIDALAKRGLSERDVEITRLMIRDLERLAAPSVSRPSGVVDGGPLTGGGKQGSLFGDLDALPLKERAQIRAGVMSAIRTDRAVFNKLVAEEKRIAGAGNRLDTQANRKRAEANATAQQLFEKLTDHGGSLGRLLDDAAAELAAGGKLAELVGSVLDDFRRAIDGLDLRDALQRLEGQRVAGAAGRGPEPAPRPRGEGRGEPEGLASPSSAPRSTVASGAVDAGTPKPVPAVDDAARFSRPGDAGTAAEADQLAGDLLRRIDEVDERLGNLPVDLEDGTQTTVRGLLDDVRADAEFIDTIRTCLK